ncbi:hypothetical protein [Tenacibaculum soleae]|uniref:hypothetical protein n=1 Tax=Tenacibaculum soleae TaxID=447689 RepID=UPI00230082F3|nr:hypothetical protein [Tenacibaculum soleae]
MNKIIQNNLNNQQVVLTEIGVYNQQIHNYLQNNKPTKIIAQAIKIFNDNAYRKKWSTLQYNKSVEDFNATHGFFLVKKGKESETRNYNYINYPYLDKQAVNTTMDNFRAHRDKYNAKAALYNKDINKFNKQLISVTKQALKDKITAFESDKKTLFTIEYNAEVDKLNLALGGNYVRKKRIQKVRHQLDNIFNVFLGFHVAQLKKRNGRLMEKGKPTTVLKNAMPRIELNYAKTLKHKLNGNLRLDICRKTLYNAIQRLIEAGVLNNYLFINKERPVYFNINPQILDVLDGNFPKKQNTDNQLLNTGQKKKLPTLNNTTRTFLLKRNKIDDCETFTDQDKCGSMPKENESSSFCLAGGYKNTDVIELKKKKGSAAEIEKILPDFLKNKQASANVNGKLRKKVVKSILNENSLAKMLKEGVFNAYKGVRYEEIQRIIQYSGLDVTELKAFLIQDFIKSSAKIWKNHNVFVGEWRKTINILQNQLFNGINHRENLLNKLKEYRWKLEFARKWFMHSDVNALYPSMYFDDSRTHKKEIGFYALHDAWIKNLKKKETAKVLEKQKQASANTRKRYLTNEQQFNNSLQKFFKGKLTKQNLYEFVKNNLPEKYLFQLEALANPKNHA